MKLVKIEWDDTSSPHNEWVVKKNIKIQPGKCITVGFVLKEMKGVIVLFTSHCDNDMISEVVIIPKGCITRKVELVEKP